MWQPLLDIPMRKEDTFGHLAALGTSHALLARHLACEPPTTPCTLQHAIGAGHGCRFVVVAMAGRVVLGPDVATVLPTSLPSTGPLAGVSTSIQVTERAGAPQSGAIEMDAAASV